LEEEFKGEFSMVTKCLNVHI